MFTLDFKKRNASILGTILFFLFFYLSYTAISRFSINTEISFYFERYRKTLEQIQQSSFDTKKTVAVFGPSDIALNLSPLQVQQQLLQKNVDAQVLNYGVILAGPDLLKNLISELHNKVSKSSKKLDLVIFRFEPMMYTNTYSRFMTVVGARFQQHSSMSIEKRLLDVFNGGYSQGTLSLYLKRSLIENVSQDPNFSLKNGVKPEFRNKYNFIWDSVAEVKVGKEWEADKNGEIDLFSEDFKNVDWENFFKKNKTEVYYGGFESHKVMYNHTGLDFSDKYFKDLNASIDLLKSISEKVIVLYIPNLFLDEFGGRTPQATLSLQKKLDDLKMDSRVELWDYSTKWQPTIEDAFDLNHFTQSGKVKFNQLISDDIYQALKK